MRKYNIGQYRYSKNKEYLSVIDSGVEVGYDLKSYYNLNENDFKDLKLTYNFKKRETYYLTCSFNLFKIPDGNKIIPQSIVVKLKNSGSSREQIVGTYDFLTENQNEKNTINLLFTPRGDFEKIVFELKRDVIYDNINGGLPRELTLYNNEFKLSRVVNILKEEGFLELKSNIFKLGVQGDSGLIICINGEAIRLGQSGMFEIYKEDFEIYSVGFIITGQEENMHFIMDYCYDKEEEVKR